MSCWRARRCASPSDPHVGGTITEIEHKATRPFGARDRALGAGRCAAGIRRRAGRAGVADALYRRLAAAVSERRRCLLLRRRVPWLSRRSIHHARGRRKRAARPSASARRFDTVPVRMRREISVDDDLLTIRETAELEGNEPAIVMWGHHPTFGSDLLAGEFEIQSGARSVTTDQEYDPPSNPLQPGATGAWPMVAGEGPDDRPQATSGGKS